MKGKIKRGLLEVGRKAIFGRCTREGSYDRIVRVSRCDSGISPNLNYQVTREDLAMLFQLD